MVLNNVSLIDSNNPVNIQIRGTQISKISGEIMPDNIVLTFENALAFPGLVNSHDHLEFNLFPQFGDTIYNNYTEWGKHIHAKFKNEIAAVLKVPVLLREQWGIIKNLICGVTTVVNHGNKLKTKDPLISVYKPYHFLHSVQFEKGWKIKLNHLFKLKLPVVVHVGEGTDQSSGNEIDQLIRWNILRKTLIGVHGVAMSPNQAKKFKALVWCPESNQYLLNKTAPVDKLKEHTTILFGTDSTLTGNWNIWEHIRLARKTKMLSDTELYNTLNLNAAAIWNTQNDEIKPGKKADIVVTKIKNGQNGLEAFFNTGPEDILLVIHKGCIRLFDAELRIQLATMNIAGYRKIYINGIGKYVKYNVPGLIKDIRQYYPEAVFPVTTD
jgi:hypothetical protein